MTGRTQCPDAGTYRFCCSFFRLQSEKRTTDHGGAIVVVNNTFATLLNQSPLALRAGLLFFVLCS
jgi:hypothetical protein